MKKFLHSATSLKGGKAPPANPATYVKLAAENMSVIALDRDPKHITKATDELAKNMQDIKTILYGDTERLPTPELAAQLAVEIFRGDFFNQLIQAIPQMEFETRRVSTQVVANLQRQKIGSQALASDYLVSHPAIVDHMIRGYESPDYALFYGSILRDCVRHQAVTQLIFNSREFPKFFFYMQMPNFEVSSDAVATFQEILTRHKAVAANFLSNKYDWFFGEFQKLLESPNYITRRMAIKMLGDILLDRSNAAILQRYVSSLPNLKTVMNLLKDQKLSIQVEAIHMFKAFVVNENRPEDITKVLVVNKGKLSDYFASFKLDKEDARVEEEKTIIIKTIESL